MANAVQAYKDAFNSYRKNLVELSIYSAFASLANVGLVICLGAVLAGAVVLLLGSLSVLSEPSAILTMGTAALAIALLAAFAAFVWVAAGLGGAYFETVNMIMAGKKQTLSGFVSLARKRAKTIFFAYLIQLIIVILIIIAFFYAIFLVRSGTALLAIIPLGVLSVMLSLMFFMMTTPAVVLENRGAVAAIRRSVSFVRKNFVAMVVFQLINLGLCLIALIPGVGTLYSVLFYMPLETAALLILFKKG